MFYAFDFSFGHIISNLGFSGLSVLSTAVRAFKNTSGNSGSLRFNRNESVINIEFGDLMVAQKNESKFTRLSKLISTLIT